MELFELDFTGSPYRLAQEEKDRILTERMMRLTAYHAERCPEYAHMLRAAGYAHEAGHCKEIPFLPVGLFKQLRLESTADPAADDTSSYKKIVTSSGTGGQRTSQVVLDGETRILQQQSLASITADFIGKKRIPMLVIDTESTVRRRDRFSARTAGIQGFSLFGTHRTFVLKEDLSLRADVLADFLKKYGDAPFLIFGFTWLVWKHFCLELEARGLYPDLSNGILIHGGGWKKLTEEAVSEEAFRARLLEVCGLTRIHDYYGMAEQSGSVFMECAYGHLHASDYSDVLVRRASDFSLCEPGEEGRVQVLSVLPRSYPGHSLLTEDEGILLGVDDCPCGRKGKYFKICGRLASAELRGCSDTAAVREEAKRTETVQSGKAYHDVPPAGLRGLNGQLTAEPAGSSAVFDIPEYVIGDACVLSRMGGQEPYVPFAEETIAFLDAWSGNIRAVLRSRRETGEAYDFSESSAFAFWCRRASLEQQRKTYDGRIADRIGAGMSLHYAAANVPDLFAYSMSAALLAGCTAALRLSSKEFLTQRILIEALEKTLQTRPVWKKRIVLFRSPHSEALNRALAKRCRARVIWGGDETVRRITQIPLPAGARDIPFPDRTSAAVIRAGFVLKQDADALDADVRDFYNDTYRNDQNACASPSMVYWLGSPEEIASAQERFWQAVSAYVQRHYALPDVLAVKKTEQAYVMAAAFTDARIVSYGNEIVCVRMGALHAAWTAYRSPGGFFIECGGTNLSGLIPALTDKVQTLTRLGMEPEQLQREMKECGFAGRKRIVPCGHALDFALDWDGKDLITEMSREIMKSI